MATNTSAIARHIALALLFVALLLSGGCRAGVPSASVAVVDLIKEYDRADLRPPGAYSIADHLAGGAALPAILGPVPGRLTWSLPIPRRGTFRARVAASAAPVRVRIGVSDARIYEQLAEVMVAPDAGWFLVSADLSAYAGWKFSLFYRPERQAWRLNLSADATAGVPAGMAWGRPEILAPAGADALEYGKRRARLTRSGAP